MPEPNGREPHEVSPPQKNEIVIYQPDKTLRLDVRLENETVWLTQVQMADLFQRDRTVITRHVRNVFSEGELAERGNVHFLHVPPSDKPVKIYSLNVVISVGYRVKSVRGTQFRIWATSVLRDYLLRGHAVNERLVQIEDRMDRRFAEHGRRLDALEGKVDFFVRTQTPPLQGVFYDGQLWDARAFVDRLVKSAKQSLVLVDNWATVETLDMLAAKQKGVAITVVTSEHRDRRGTPRPKILPADVARFNAQYPTLSVRFRENFHDRFLVIDDRELYLIGASLKDLGRKCFGFTRMDPSEIAGLKARM
jgi:hypothetical protein